MLTTAQATVLATAIKADTDPAVVAARDNESGRIDTLLADLYNQPSATVVWKSSVTQDEIMQNGFDWTQVDNTTVGKARIWEWMFNNDMRSINPSKANVRAGIDEAWKGTAAMLAVRAAVYVHCKRLATKCEALFATGVGTEESPSVMGYEGTITGYDVSVAMNANP